MMNARINGVFLCLNAATVFRVQIPRLPLSDKVSRKSEHIVAVSI